MGIRIANAVGNLRPFGIRPVVMFSVVWELGQP